MKPPSINRNTRCRSASYPENSEKILTSDIGDVELSSYLHTAYSDTVDFALWTTLLKKEDRLSSPLETELPDIFWIGRDLMKQLWESPTARSLINFAAHSGWAMGVQSLEDGAYLLETDQKNLLLNDYGLRTDALQSPGYFRHAFLLSLIRAVRDIWHIENRWPQQKNFNLESILLTERIRMADCDIMALLVAWELRGEGYPESWRHLIGSPEGDMALIFSRTLEYNPYATFTGQALCLAFDQWFEDDVRVNACDHITLEMIDEDLRDGADQHRYGSHCVSPVYLESLSKLADQCCYLQGRGEGLLQNPLYSGLCDEVNQSHYKQIRNELACVRVGSVAFRDPDLAQKLFPQDPPSRIKSLLE